MISGTAKNMRKTKKEKGLTVNLILLACTIILFFVVFEIAVRSILGPGRIEDQAGNPAYINDDELGVKLKPNFRGHFKEIDFNTEFNTNSLGYRSYEFDNTDKNIIFMLGDSFVVGSGVEENETVAHQLEKKLNGWYKVYNLGVPGYSQRQHVKQLEKLLPVYKPRIVIENIYLGNDLTDNCNELPGIDRNITTYEGIKRIIKKSQAFIFLYRRIVVPFKYPKNLDFYIDNPDTEKCYELTKRYLKDIKLLTDNHNARLIVTFIGREPQTVKSKEEELISWYDNFEEYKNNKDTFDLNRINKKLEDICNNIKANCFDLTPVFLKYDGKRKLYLKDGHWNREGHTLAAEELAKYLNTKPSTE